MNRAAAELEGSIARARALLDKTRVADQDVHEARKALKKARAALRLLRPAIPKALYRKANLDLRDAGRALSPVRDARSQLDILERLPPRFGHLGAGLRDELASARAHSRRGTRNMRACLGLLQQAGAWARNAALQEAPQPALETGLRQVYRKGRRALREAAAERSPEALHEWRKQIKHLSNALEILGAAQRRDGARALRRAEAVADRLGDDRDLALLGKRHPSEKKLRRHIASRRRKLQRKAFEAGRKLYAKKNFRRVIMPSK